MGDSITFNTPKDGQVAYMHGIITDVKTGKPLANAEIDIWQASTNGKDVLGFHVTLHTILMTCQVCTNSKILNNKI